MKRNIVLTALIILVVNGCKKNSTPGPTPPPVDNGPVAPVIPSGDQGHAATVGFFTDDWTGKNFVIPAYTETTAPTAVADVAIAINPQAIITAIPAAIYGQNANSWMGKIVTDNTLFGHINELHSGVVRFPGGSISDIYFWNQAPGTQPADAPSSLINAAGISTPTSYWVGKNNDSWTISADNYYQLLQASDNKGMITVNYGYARYSTATDPVAAAAHLAADWVRYDNGRTKYWEIGNENFGDWEAGFRINTADNKDGQPEFLTGALYGQHFKVFADSMRKAATEKGAIIQIGAVLMEKDAEAWQNNTAKTWNQGVYTQAGNSPDFYSVHSYYTNYRENTNAATILSSATTITKDIMSYYSSKIIAAGLVKKPLALTEWNINAEGSMQKVSYISGMHATLLLGQALSEKYGMAGRWDLANAWESGNDHGLFNIGDETGVSKWNPRPSFYYMYYFQKMMGDKLVGTSLSTSVNIYAYGSTFSSGQKAITIVNTGTASKVIAVSLQNATAGNRFYWYTLTGGSDNGEFSRKVYVNGKTTEQTSGGPADYTTLKANAALTSNGIRLAAPAHSVIYVVIE